MNEYHITKQITEGRMNWLRRKDRLRKSQLAEVDGTLKNKCEMFYNKRQSRNHCIDTIEVGLVCREYMEKA